MYGTAAGIESVVDIEFAEVEVEDEDVASRCSDVLGDDDKLSQEMMFEVERFDNVGRLGLEPFPFNLDSSS